MKIRLDNVVKTFDTFRAVHGVSLDIESGELVALLGPSGSGKTTILRMVAGLEYADGGHIYFGDQDATDIPVRDRGVGFVFQHYALFPHMTVAENIGFGMKVSKVKRTKGEMAARVTELLRLVKLDNLGNRFPSQISGGQRQRVALARALAVDPKVLLLDEPFGALDANVRRDLRRWLREIHEELGITTLFVTHDQEEALDLADRVVILNEGKIVQEGTPEAVCRNPNSAFVMNFSGRRQPARRDRCERQGRARRNRAGSGWLRRRNGERLSQAARPRLVGRWPRHCRHRHARHRQTGRTAHPCQDGRRRGDRARRRARDSSATRRPWLRPHPPRTGVCRNRAEVAKNRRALSTFRRVAR